MRELSVCSRKVGAVGGICPGGNGRATRDEAVEMGGMDDALRVRLTDGAEVVRTEESVGTDDVEVIGSDRMGSVAVIVTIRWANVSVENQRREEATERK